MLNRAAQQYYLNAMGMPQWCLRDNVIEGVVEGVTEGVVKAVTEPVIGSVIDSITNEDGVYIPSALGIFPHQIVSQEVDTQDIPQPVATKTETTADSTNTILAESVVDTDVINSESAIIATIQSPSDQGILTELDSNISEQSVLQEQIDSQLYQQAGFETPQIEINENKPVNYLFQSIAEKISACRLCSSRLSGDQSLKIQLLKKSSSSNKNILLLVDSPSTDEYKQGCFLSGLHHSLINSIFKAVDLDVNIYISAINKCLQSDPYSIADKDTIDTQITNCLPFLKQEIDKTGADLVVTMGSIPFRHILEDNDQNNSLSLQQSMGKLFKIKQSLYADKNRQLPLVTTFHPAFLFRNPLFKPKALQHWIEVTKLLKN